MDYEQLTFRFVPSPTPDVAGHVIELIPRLMADLLEQIQLKQPNSYPAQRDPDCRFQCRFHGVGHRAPASRQGESLAPVIGH